MLFGSYSILFYIDIEESAISFKTKFFAPKEMTKEMAKKGRRNEKIQVYLCQKHCLSSNTSNIEIMKKFSPGTLGAFCT